MMSKALELRVFLIDETVLRVMESTMPSSSVRDERQSTGKNM